MSRATGSAEDAERCGPGGVGHYAALTLQRLGQRVAVVTRLAEADRDELLAELRTAGVAVVCGGSAATSSFECAYSRQAPDERRLAVLAVAEPFTPSDLDGVDARWLHLGPLTSRDMSQVFIRAAAALGRVALDAQGLVRRTDGAGMRLVRPVDAASLLRHVALLKVDAREAAILSREGDVEAAARRLHALGPDEVIVTRGGEGALIFDGNALHTIAAVPAEIVDPTGCGDTYLAAYLSRRIARDEPRSAGRFAAAAAALTLERECAFWADEAAVRERMK